MIFDGKKFAAEKEEILKAKVADLRQKGSVPKLVSFLVGENPESELYTRLKQEAAERIGIIFETKKFDSFVDPQEMILEIKQLNEETSVHGIMVQLPLPEKFGITNSETKILGSIKASKDVDCLTPENLGLLMMGKPRFLPATVRAIWEILAVSYQSSVISTKWLTGKSVCLVGASEIVGKPLVMVLSEAGATVTICRSATKNLGDFTQKADILISATGVPGLIKKGMVKEKAIVIDVGIKKIEEKIFGDVDKDVYEVAGFITPVPSGVGPVTVISLLENLIEICQNYV